MNRIICVFIQGLTLSVPTLKYHWTDHQNVSHGPELAIMFNTWCRLCQALSCSILSLHI